MDDYLEVTGVTGDGIPEVLFHSGFKGASDSVMIEHILLYDASDADFRDKTQSNSTRPGHMDYVG
jgi:hypothetical protein